MSLHQYIGARYVPKFYENSLDPSSSLWESNVTYEPLTVVTLVNEHCYISKKTVPDTVGTPADNADYWCEVGNANAYIHDLQDQIDDINDNKLPALQDEINLALTGDKLYNALRKLNHHKILVVGDSLSDNTTYPPNWLDKAKQCIVDNDLDITINTDLCVNGSSWCGFADTGLNLFDPFTTNEFDIVLVALGVNDFQGQFYCGIYSDTTLWHGDTYNLSVGIKLVLAKIREKFPNALQYGIIPHRWDNTLTVSKPLALYRWCIGSMLLQFGARIIDWSAMPMFAPSMLGTFDGFVTAGDMLHPQSAYAEILASYTFEKLADGGDSSWRISCDQTTFSAQDGSGSLRVSWYSNGQIEMRGREVLDNAALLNVGYTFALFKDIPTEILESIDEYAPDGVIDQTYPAVCSKDDANKKIMVTVPYSGGAQTSVTIIDYRKNLRLYTPYRFGYGIDD